MRIWTQSPPGRHARAAPWGNGAHAAALAAVCCLIVTASIGYAADKSGVSFQSVVLPSGPGSVKGMDGDIDPDLTSGAAEYEVGIETPPGTNDMAPEDLGLAYSSGGGNGVVGFGWGMDAPFVQRRPERPFMRYVDENNNVDDDHDGTIDEPDELDRFICAEHDMPSYLIRREDGYYFGRIEGVFIRYERSGESWAGTLPNGTRREFGLTAASRIAHPATGKTFRWNIEQETDMNGNMIRYFYTSFPSPENQYQLYLSRIEYGPGAPPWDNFHFAAFEYEPRQDVLENGSAGFLLRTGMRLKTIFVGTQGPDLPGHLAGDFNGDGIPDRLNRKYVLEYDGHPVYSRLGSITQYGADGTTVLPSQRFSYTTLNPPDSVSAMNFRLGSLNPPDQLMDKDWVEISDLNGDGLADILRTNPAGGLHIACLNQGEANEDGRKVRWSDGIVIGGDPQTFTVTLSAMSNAVAQLNDVNGDARADLVYKSGPFDVFYFKNEVAGGLPQWGERTRLNLFPGSAAPPSPFDTDNVETADIDGDTRIDVYQSISVGGVAHLRVWLNLSGGAYSAPYTVPQQFSFQLSDPGVEGTEFNGDGIPDIVRIRTTGVEVAPGLCHGKTGPLVFAPFPDIVLTSIQLDHASLEDISGDGLPDLVIERAAPGEVWYWLNLGYYRFDQRRIITDLPIPIGSTPALRWADFNGNGTIDLAYADPYMDPPLAIVDIGEALGCVPAPNLLTKVDNGLGRIIQMEYKSSIQFCLADAAAGTPWPDPVPTPVQVVSSVTVDNSLGNSQRTEFFYHDGYYHPEELFFTGFGRVDVRTQGGPSAPVLVNRYTFDVGRDIFELQGSLLRHSAETEDGQAFWEETSTYEAPVLAVGMDESEIRYPQCVAEEKTLYELGNGAPKTTRTEFVHDEYGNETEVRELGVVEEGNPDASGDERVVTTEYALNLEAWIVNKPIREITADLDGKRVLRSETYYDDETFSGENFGEVVRGNETLTYEWDDAGDETDLYIIDRKQYDAFGNVISLIDPLAEVTEDGINDELGHYRTIVYDGRFHSFPVGEIIHVGGGKEDLTLSAAYDEGFAAVVSSTDFNGAVTSYGYDMFGRFSSSVRPGDDPAYPTLAYRYVLGEPFGSGAVNYVETWLLDRKPGDAGPEVRDHYFVSRSYLDGMGRKLMDKEEAEPASGSSIPRVGVRNASQFNERGETETVLQPFFTMMPGDTLDALLAFEDIAAPGWQGTFHQEGALVDLALADAPKTTLAYDALLRERTVTNPDGTQSRKENEPLILKFYDENDTNPASPFHDTPVLQYTDGLGRLVQLDEVVRLTDGGEPSAETVVWTTRYEYRTDDLLTRIIDAQDNEKIMGYDGFQELIYVNDCNSGEKSLAYDNNGNLVETVDAMGHYIAYFYDGANRLIAKDYYDEEELYSAGFVYDPLEPLSPENRADIMYFYDDPYGPIDPGNGSGTIAANTKGKTAYVWNLAGETHYSYDARGNLTWAVVNLWDPDTGLTLPYQTTLHYDSQDRVAEVIYPDGDRCAYAYNQRLLPAAISGGGPLNREGTPFILAEAEYGPAEERMCEVFGNGVVMGYAYDARGRLVDASAASNAALDMPYIHYQYVFDPVSNITAVHDLRLEETHPYGDPRRNTQFFQYDDLYRLTRAQVSFQAPDDPSQDDGRIDYRYDRLGNMTSMTSGINHLFRGYSVTNLGAMSYGGALGAAGRIGRTTPDPGPHALSRADTGDVVREFSYDAIGNLTQGDGFSCTWNFEDQLVAIEDSSMRAEYTYNHDGRRVLKRVWPKNAEGVLAERPAETVWYLGRHFEVREGGQPTKYVFNGKQRIAKITGTLDPDALRVQRFQAAPGWNLWSMAVNAGDAAAQLGVGTDAAIDGAFRWDASEEAFVPVAADSSLPAGAIFWLHLTEHRTLTVSGAYSEAGSSILPVQTGYVALTGLEALRTKDIFADRLDFAWCYDASEAMWHAYVGGEGAFLSDMPDFIRPGEAIFVRAEDPAEIELPPSARRIQYYHQDYLNSSNIIADAAGNVLEEIAYYPFGEPRQHFRADARVQANPYLFAQKERDKETGLHYFEARYLAASLGRFLQVDPELEDTPDEALYDPQTLHAYGYARNNPITYTDPTGLFIETPIFRREMKSWSPFSNVNIGNPKLTMSERYAKVFGALQVKKGGSMPKAGPNLGGENIPGFIKEALEIDKQKIKESDRVLSAIAQMAENIKNNSPKDKKNRIDADQFLKLFTKPRTFGPLKEGTQLTEGGREIISAKTFVDKLVDKKFAKLLNNFDSQEDYENKYKELMGVAEKSFKGKKAQAFKFNPEDANKFIEKYMKEFEDHKDLLGEQAEVQDSSSEPEDDSEWED